MSNDIKQIKFNGVVLDLTKKIINDGNLLLCAYLADELYYVQNLAVRQDGDTISVQADGKNFLKIRDGQLIDVNVCHVQDIGYRAFSGIPALENVVISDRVYEIG